VKIALIGDVHGNLPALEAVLEHARRQGMEAIWNVGDFVGYGPFPDQVVRRLRGARAVSIVGNYDLKVLKFRQKRKKWRKKKQLDKFLGFQWAAQKLSRKSRRYLRSLPKQREVQTEGLRILLTHGSPASNTEHLGPDTPVERLRQLAEMAAADLIVCGHSHRPFVRHVDDTCFVNTGSVGRPDDGDPRACYAILQLGPDNAQPRIDVRRHRLTYDVQEAVAAIRAHGLPEAFAQMLIQGRNLDGVMVAPETWDTPALDPLPWDEPETERRLRAVLRLAETCGYEEEHTRQATWLSLRLFDELQPLHRLGAVERFWLRCAALLHDIGWIEGQKGHHKTSLRLILDAPDLPFDERERFIVGSTARYHRGALPKDKHDHFAVLSPVDQRVVTILAAILRVADGLDRTHMNVVEDLRCVLLPEQIIVNCVARANAEPERERALEKGDLLERAFDRRLTVTWHRA
jgi:putative phosphoesterase